MTWKSSGRKSLLASVSAAGVCLTQGACHAQGAPLPSGWWKLDGTVRAAAPQSGLGAGALQQVGSVTWGKGFGKTKSLVLNGRGCLQLSHAPIDISKSYTITAWVKINHLGGWQTFVSEDGPVQSGFFLQLRDDTDTFGFVVTHHGEGLPNAVVTSTDVPTPGEWYHIAGVYNAVRHTVELFVNGKLQGRARCAPPTNVPGPPVISTLIWYP